MPRALPHSWRIQDLILAGETRTKLATINTLPPIGRSEHGSEGIAVFHNQPFVGGQVNVSPEYLSPLSILQLDQWAGAGI